MKVVVTGAAGFIGFHVCKALCERGDEVVGLDNLNDYYDVTLKRRAFSYWNPCPVSVSLKWISLIGWR